MKALLLMVLCCSWMAVAPAWAVDRYVDNTPPSGCTNGVTNYTPAGNGSCGTGGTARFYTSIGNALAAQTTQAGDRLYIRAGTYAEGVDSNAHTIPTGTTWENAPIISGYQSEVVTLRTGGGANIINLVDQSYIQYLKFANLVLDGVGSSMDNVVCIGTGVQKVHHISFDNVEVKNGPHIGVFFHGHFNIFRGGSVHDIGDTAVFPPPFEYYGFYVEGDDNLVERTEVYNTKSYGIHNHSSHPTGGTRNEYRYLNLHHTSTMQASQGAIVLGAGIDSILHHSVIYSSAAHGVVVYSVFSEGSKVYNNTIYGSVGTGIKIQDNAPGAIIANNLLFNNGATIDDGGVNTSLVTNQTTNPSFVNAASADFHLLSSSTAINTGTASIGGGITVPFNGSGVDKGRYETFAPSQAMRSGSSLALAFQSHLSANLPMLPASGATGLTVGCAGSQCGTPVVSSVTRTADATFQLTLTGTTCVAGQTWTVSGASSNITDGIGQPMFNFSNFSATNACSGGDFTPPAPPTGVTVT